MPIFVKDFGVGPEFCSQILRRHRFCESNCEWDIDFTVNFNEDLHISEGTFFEFLRILGLPKVCSPLLWYHVSAIYLISLSIT